MKTVVVFFLFLLSSSFLLGQGQATRAAWTEAKNLCNEQEYAKAKPFLLKVHKEMPRSLCGYWLGLAYDINDQRDSAVFYYKSSIKNSGKNPPLAAWEKLIRVQLRQLDFKAAYATAWEAMQKYPGNTTFIEEFKEVCKWSYFINHLQFEKSYLSSTKLHKEYPIKTISEQELIIKNIRNPKGESLQVGNRQYKGMYELWKCNYQNSRTSVDIKFNLASHDIDRLLEEEAATAKTAYNNKENPIDIRLGALLTLLPITDKQMLDLLASNQEAVRFCTCTEVKSSSSKKVKKSCLSDSSELIRSTCEQLSAFK